MIPGVAGVERLQPGGAQERQVGVREVGVGNERQTEPFALPQGRVQDIRKEIFQGAVVRPVAADKRFFQIYRHALHSKQGGLAGGGVENVWRRTRSVVRRHFVE